MSIWAQISIREQDRPKRRIVKTGNSIVEFLNTVKGEAKNTPTDLSIKIWFPKNSVPRIDDFRKFRVPGCLARDSLAGRTLHMEYMEIDDSKQSERKLELNLH